MKESRGRVNKFKIGDFVAIKIDKVDKTSPLHPNVLLGKVIEVQESYSKVVTKFGVISTYKPAQQVYSLTIIIQLPFHLLIKRQSVNKHMMVKI